MLFDFKVKNDSTRALLKKIRGLDYKKALQKIEDAYEEDIEKNFDRQGALYQGEGYSRLGGGFANLARAGTRGRAWKKLAESTKKDRANKGFSPSRPILQRKGKLRNSFRSRINSGKKEVRFWNTASYANVHQFGTDKVPARIILGTHSKIIDQIKLIVADYLKTEIQRG